MQLLAIKNFLRYFPFSLFGAIAEFVYPRSYFGKKKIGKSTEKEMIIFDYTLLPENFLFEGKLFHALSNELQLEIGQKIDCIKI